MGQVGQVTWYFHSPALVKPVLTLKVPITIIVVCFVFCRLLLKVIVANSVNPDQTAPLGAV